MHQLYQYASKYYDGVSGIYASILVVIVKEVELKNLASSLQIISSLEEDPAAQNKQLTLRLQQIAAALENKVTDL